MGHHYGFSFTGRISTLKLVTASVSCNRISIYKNRYSTNLDNGCHSSRKASCYQITCHQDKSCARKIIWEMLVLRLQ